MKKIFIILVAAAAFFANPVLAAAAAKLKPVAGWKPMTPEGFTPITWTAAPGIASFFKAPDGNGTLDFLTRIYLPQNQIQFIVSTTTPPADWGWSKGSTGFIISDIANQSSTLTTTVAPTTTENPSNHSLASMETPPFVELPAESTNPNGPAGSFHNFAFGRFVAEAGKTSALDAKFIWNGPFFNIMLSTTDLSLALKGTFKNSTIISSGSRPFFDMANDRRMLLINNRTAKANIQDFDAGIFVGAASGDQAIEGFAPNVNQNDSASQATARLFMGVMPGKQEIVIYCSRSATVGEASRALAAAGVPIENQLQADGGGSVSCGYNLPGQYFVEPARTLPLLMGAITVLARGAPTTNGLNVRSGPGAKFLSVAKLNKTDAVVIFEEKNGWYRIGEEQWVIKTLIKKQ